MPGGHAIGPRCAAQTQIDPVAEHVGQGAVLFGDHQRGVVGEHDPAGAHTDPVGDGGSLPDQQCGGTGGQVHGVVVFGEPQPVIPQFIGEPGGVHGGCDGIAGGGPLGDGHEVEDVQRY